VLLESKELTKHFGGLAAVNEFDMSVARAEIVGLIGPDGAGKTTAFNSITGVYPSTRGQVIYDAERSALGEKCLLGNIKRKPCNFSKEIFTLYSMPG
jgi:ABC-type branched-subunit amino acid transport system ATPase component